MNGRLEEEVAVLAAESALSCGSRESPKGGVAILEDARDEDEALVDSVLCTGWRRPTLGFGDMEGNDMEADRRLERGRFCMNWEGGTGDVKRLGPISVY